MPIRLNFERSKKWVLTDPVTVLYRTGPSLGNKLAKIGIAKIEDLLFHLPYRYIDRTHLTPIGALRPGDYAYIQGRVELTQVCYSRRRSLLCRISDNTGAALLRFFYFSKAQVHKLKREALIRCYGQVRRRANSFEIIHPEYRHLNEHEDNALDEKLTPVYPSTEGLKQTSLRRLTMAALETLKNHETDLVELLPEPILTSLRLPTLVNALEYVHLPPPDADVKLLSEGAHPAQQRLAFEEILAHQLGLITLRSELRTGKAPLLPESGELASRYLKNLPFNLTSAQQRAHKIIAADLNKAVSMLRLLQGDVGSGKTVVSALAALQAIEARYQVAMMAPTELLAEQHYANFRQWLTPLDIDVLLLTGKLKKSDRAEIQQRMREEKPFIVIGTHVLFQKFIGFAKLGLVIIDEQHRFGVHQRFALLEKFKAHNEYPHQLIMSATPIPRTLMMTAYADLDHTVIDELPPGRQAVNTYVISNKRREDILRRISRVLGEDRQVYWVCTLIEESEKLQCEAAIDTADTLKERLPKVEIGLIHGRMKTDEKDAVMRDFKAGVIKLMVATTIIEVGIDVPNASLMIIDNADRLGLSQLHQLRGRIGRGTAKSDCILMYQPPLGDLAEQRLDIMRKSDNGFIIAEKDLELRGPGEVLGTRQSGMPSLRIADLRRDAHLLPDIQKAVKILARQYPEKVELLMKRWFGNRLDYSHV